MRAICILSRIGSARTAHAEGINWKWLVKIMKTVSLSARLPPPHKNKEKVNEHILASEPKVY